MNQTFTLTGPRMASDTKISRRGFLSTSIRGIAGISLAGLPGCVTALRNMQEDAWECWFIDVGYGDATLLRKHDQVVMIDGGYSVCSGYLLRFLSVLRIRAVQTLILTHPHPDHIGGLHGIMISGLKPQRMICPFPLEHFEIPESFRSFVLENGIDYEVVLRGDFFTAGGFRFLVLNPSQVGQDLNDSSLVLRLENVPGGILLGSDVGAGVQNEIATRFGNGLQSRILKVPHHGGAADPQFAEAVSPELAYISVGVNPYGNPHSETIRMYEDLGSQVVLSSEKGTMRIVHSETDPVRVDFSGMRWGFPVL